MNRRHALIHTLVSLALPAAATQPALQPPPNPIGRWVGDARLFDKALRARATPLPAEIHIDQDLMLNGRIGQALIPTSRPVSATAMRLEYQVLLQGQVKDIAELNQTHLVLIVTRHSDGRLDADFHLKSRFGFDPAMRVGHLDVQRAP